MSAKHTHCNIGTIWETSLGYLDRSQLLGIAKAYARRNGISYRCYFDERLDQNRIEFTTRSEQQMKRFASYLLDHQPSFEFY